MNQKLFSHMAENHDLILLESELDDIVRAAVPDCKYPPGTAVDKVSGYRFPGVVVSVFFTTYGKLRYVVQMTEPYGLLHIFNEEQLKKV